MSRDIVKLEDYIPITEEEWKSILHDHENGGVDSHDVGRLISEIEWLKILNASPRVELVSRDMTRDIFDEQFGKALDGEIQWITPKILARVWKYCLVDGLEEKSLVGIWKSGIFHYGRIWDGQNHTEDLVPFLAIHNPVREG